MSGDPSDRAPAPLPRESQADLSPALAGNDNVAYDVPPNDVDQHGYILPSPGLRSGDAPIWPTSQSPGGAVASNDAEHQADHDAQPTDEKYMSVISTEDC